MDTLPQLVVEGGLAREGHTMPDRANGKIAL
jgi:hypothetical protein